MAFRLKRAFALAAIVAGAGVVGNGPALAATATGTLSVSGTVVNTCTVTGGSLAFGTNLDGLTVATGQGTFSVTCTNGDTGVPIALDAGVGTGASLTTTREMTGADGTTLLNYNLYTTSAYSTIWGDGTGSTVTQVAIADGTAHTYTVYGRIPAGQTPGAQLYTDSVTITVTY